MSYESAACNMEITKDELIEDGLINLSHDEVQSAQYLYWVCQEYMDAHNTAELQIRLRNIEAKP